MKKDISIIAALSNNRAIGKNNQLLYNLPGDMRMFRLVTEKQTVIMGRKTFDSLPSGALPNRENIVITRSDIKLNGAKVCHSIEEALELASRNRIFFIGGGQIYKQVMEQGLANTMYLTIVDDAVEDADTFFPEWGPEWTLLSNEYHKADIKNKYNYSFQIWKK